MISTHSPNEWDRVSEAICLGLSVDFMACVQDVAVMTKMGLGLGLGSGIGQIGHTGDTIGHAGCKSVSMASPFGLCQL